MTSLTILICTHNRADLLWQVLESLNESDRPQDWRIDILVIANACNDRTHQLLDDYVAGQANDGRLPMRWIAEPTPGKSHALNRGLSQVESDLVFLEDDDQRVAKDFLVKVCQAAEQYPQASIICGRLLPDWQGDEPTWIREEGPYRIYPGPIPDFDPSPVAKTLTEDDNLPSGGNLILRSELIGRVGPFSTELGPKGHNLGGGEDTAFIRKAMAMGESLVFAPEILQFHYVDPQRLRTPYLVKLAFHRTYAVVRMGPRLRRIPLYVWRKLLTHVTQTLFSLSRDKRRFYLVRTAATLGEIRGFYERRFGRQEMHES